jgi:hypothetical protein
MDHVIRTRDLTKRFGHRIALDALDVPLPALDGRDISTAHSG